ncbi:fatty acyl-CoA reductase wat-like [Uranotaenia lowii]|uniref:fatty acyl-CoA reductase wat-like n=1 Tax=Uranotaenia lowii TaxID=190385 RepID=UPI002479DB2C|nr:fatty acyl-CoA reductase wat-like [Uranotaenia lowii]
MQFKHIGFQWSGSGQSVVLGFMTRAVTMITTNRRRPTIPETFAGAHVFITGATGFMGKILVEKLLRACPDVGQLFVLIRPLHGQSCQDRIDEMFKIPLFDMLRQTRPEVFKKVIPVSGDCSQLKMGLDDHVFETLSKVQFIFHVAASVRFDDPLRKAILLNVRGTREVLEWATSLKNLKAVIHVSTCYSNPELLEIEERLYPCKMPWQKAIELAEKIEPENFESFCPMLTGYAPNTYTFTKGLAEHLCNDYRHRLPLAIIRPSIVLNIEKDPLPGWIDNLNGPVGLISGVGAGIMRTGYLNLDVRMNLIPADVCIKAFIIAAWKQATSSSDLSNDCQEIKVYNCAGETHKAPTYRDIFKYCLHWEAQRPFVGKMWYTNYTHSWCIYMYYVLFFLLQLVPAIFFDTLLRLSGRKPLLVKLQRKVFHSMIMLQYFTFNNWNFHTENFRSMDKDLHESDEPLFNIKYIQNGLYEYTDLACLGGRRYIFKDPDESIPKGLEKNRKLYILHIVWQTTLIVSFMYLIYKRYAGA